MKTYITLALVSLVAVAVWLKIIDHNTIVLAVQGFLTVGLMGFYGVAVCVPFFFMWWLLRRLRSKKRPSEKHHGPFLTHLKP